MVKHNTLVAGVVFKGVEDYIKDYINSINIQTDSDFDLLIINDGGNKEIQNEFSNAIWIDLNLKYTPSSIRQVIINYAIENKYKFLVFSDIDDSFLDNRIEISKKYLANYDFVCNDLTLVNEANKKLEENYLTNLFHERIIDNVNLVIDRNIIGLGNSAIRLTPGLNINIPHNIIAADWFLFTVLLLNNSRGIFTDETVTYYRQHHENLVGISNRIDEKKLNLGLQVKLFHYNGIVKYCKSRKLPEINLFLKKHQEINELVSALRIENFRQFYIDLVNANYEKIYCGWWSEIITLEQTRLYST